MRRRRKKLAITLALGATVCLLGAGAMALGGLAQEAQATETQTGKVQTRVSPGKLLITLPWGSGWGEVGLTRPPEGLAHGPEALAVAPGGRIAVLDSVNKRVVCLSPEGTFTTAASVALAEPRFLAVDDERLYVLDCDTDRLLAVLDWEGRIAETLVLPELPDVVTGLFATAQGPSVEVAHNDTYLLTSTSSELTAAGTGDSRASAKPAGTDLASPLLRRQASLRALAGRPVEFGLGRAVKVTFRPTTGVQIKSLEIDPAKLNATREIALNPTLAEGQALEYLVSVDGDGQGGLIIGARLLEAGSRADSQPALALTRLPGSAFGEGQGPAKKTAAATVLLLVDRSMVYVGQPYVVAPDGRIFQPVAEEQGYSILVHEVER